MTIPNIDRDTLQARNRQWWDANPMCYDWQKTLRTEPGTREFFEEVDERFFRAHAAFGHPDYPNEPAFNRLLNYTGRRGQQALEIGCGMGSVAAVMAREGLRVTALDLSATAVEMTRRRFDLAGLSGLILQADGEQLPFADETFDLVWSWGVIHHSANTERIVSEMYRVLKPGGEVKVMVYHRRALRNWIAAGLHRGILRGEFLHRRYDDILRDVTDGYIARHMTSEQARALFSAYEDVGLMLTDYADLSYLPGNIQVNRHLVGRVIPRRLKQHWDNWLISRYGWFLYLEARRPERPVREHAEIPSEVQPAAILTIETATPGGIPTLVETIYALMRRWGYDPAVYRTRFGGDGLSRWQYVRSVIRHWRPHSETINGLRTVVVPALPLPLWMLYLVPHFMVGPLLGKFPAVFATSGSAHVALPLALRGQPYVLWVATRYEDELQAKADVGDRWAQGVLSSPMWRILEAQERLVLRRAARVLALSYHTSERIKALAPDVADRLETVLFPIDLERFRPDPAVRSDPPHGRYLLFAARINDPRKNVHMLLNAFAVVRQQHPDLRLVLVGEEPDEALRRHVDEMELARAVIFGGVVSADELLRLYQGAELFVLPSVQEGLGIVVLEALACGTPVVSTPCGGPEGIVLEGQTGRMVDTIHDPGVFAGAILDLLSDPTRLADLRERCVAFAAAHFAAPVVAAQLEAAYRHVVDSKPRPSKLRDGLVAVWAVFVLAAYLQHQMAIHWPAIEVQIITPLLSTLR